MTTGRRRSERVRGGLLPAAGGLDLVRLRAAARLGFGGATVDAAGVYLRGPDREQYLEVAAGADVPLGYAHPAVLAAVESTLDDRLAGSPLLADLPRLAVGALLSRLRPAGLVPLGLFGGGRAALEAAVAVARALSGREPTRLEPLQPDGAVPPGAATPAVAPADLARTMLVVDERRLGPGRLGRLLAAEALGLRPDLLVVGGLGGGLAPAAALLAAPVVAAAVEAAVEGRVAEALASAAWPGVAEDFAGPVACAAAAATLETLADGALAARAAAMGEAFGAELAALAADVPETLVEVRGAGLAWTIECTVPEVADRLVRRLAVDRILVAPPPWGGRAIRIVPPLVVEKRELDFVVSSIAQACEE